MKVEYIVMIVGAGGTGGNFAKEYARYASFFHKKGVSVKAVLIDGDHVEKKNEERQPFGDGDLEQNKAASLVSAIEDTFQKVDIKAYPHFIDDACQLEQVYKNLATYKYGDDKTMSIPVLVGCVDNHRARQCMHTWFEKRETIFYFDSANEFTDGEVVMGGRLGGKQVAPDRAFYYPDVLTDRSPSASELSCGMVNESSPQHLATNLMAANILLSAVVSLVSENLFQGGIVYFDRKRFFSRFQPFEGRGLYEKE
jgi:hypothetical protein